jgi:hypothetical protein
MTLYRHFPERRSAALRKMAALSFQGIASHCSFAFRAEVIAFLVISGVAL